MKKSLLIIVSLFLLLGCKKYERAIELPDAIESRKLELLDSAKNRYPKGSKQLERANFLIINSMYHSHYEGQTLDTLTKALYEADSYSTAQFYKLKDYPRESLTPDSLELDALSIKEDMIFNHIDSIDFYLKENRWADSIPEHIKSEFLTYKIQREGFSDWLESYRDEIRPLVVSDSLLDQSFKDAVASVHLYDFQRTLGFSVKGGSDLQVFPAFSMLSLKDLWTGSCYQLAMRSVGRLRAAGIPATIDYTPIYVNHNVGHSWPVAIFNDSIFIPQDATTYELGKFKWEYFNLAKVYRTTFSPQRNSHFMKAGYKAYLPEFLNDPFIKDVTHLYIKTVDYKIPSLKTDDLSNEWSYLKVFSAREGWKYVAWGTLEDNVATFNDVGLGGVFLPVIKNDRGFEESLNYPFHMNKEGKITFLKPNLKKEQQLRLTRKFPMTERKRLFLERMVGGVFEGSNNNNFSQSAILATIDDNPGEHFNTIKSNTKTPYRYVRYLGPDGSYANVAEIQFLNAGKKLTGKVIGTDGSWEDNPLVVKEAAFDDNPLTYVDAQMSDKAWVGLDLGRKIAVDEIKYLARNDMNATQKGDEYELFYWENKWVSMGRKISNSTELVYDACPTNALFWLKNLTTGNEERIFTYENGEQIWW